MGKMQHVVDVVRGGSGGIVVCRGVEDCESLSVLDDELLGKIARTLGAQLIRSVDYDVRIQVVLDFLSGYQHIVEYVCTSGLKHSRPAMQAVL